MKTMCVHDCVTMETGSFTNQRAYHI